jgi:nucleotide-binding universal stress UspA family protein
MFKRIGLALAFSPTCKALLLEAKRLQNLFDSELILIHVGIKDDKSQQKMNELVQFARLEVGKFKLIWRLGEPSATIIELCKEEKIDLLIAGALRHENLLKYYVGSIALKILRQAPCSLLILIEPSMEQIKYEKVAIEAEDLSPYSGVLEVGVRLAKIKKANHLYFVREARFYNLGLSVLSEYSMGEVSEIRKKILRQEYEKVEERLTKIDLKETPYTIKIVAGKTGYELGKYARNIKADMLVVGAVKKRLNFIDRLFTNNLEFIFEDIPCNLLVIKNKKL